MRPCVAALLLLLPALALAVSPPTFTEPWTALVSEVDPDGTVHSVRDALQRLVLASRTYALVVHGIV